MTEKDMEETIVDGVKKSVYYDAVTKFTEQVRMAEFSLKPNTTDSDKIFLHVHIPLNKIFQNPSSYSDGVFVYLQVILNNVSTTEEYTDPTLSIYSTIRINEMGQHNAYILKYKISRENMEKMFEINRKEDGSLEYKLKEFGCPEYLENRIKEILYETEYSDLDGMLMCVIHEGENQSHKIIPKDGAFVRTPKNGLYQLTYDEHHEEAGASLRWLIDSIKAGDKTAIIFTIILIIVLAATILPDIL